VAHELVHLEMREGFGDCPPWLEEGLASEVAVAGIRNGVLTFGKSWRDRMLEKLEAQAPTVAQLLRSPWSAFSTQDPAEVDRVAATQAMAAVFVRYLQERGLLNSVFASLRDDVDAKGLGVSDSKTLTTKSGESLEQLDQDFHRWFRRLPEEPPGAKGPMGLAEQYDPRL
jgi:hypothetical protein